MENSKTPRTFARRVLRSATVSAYTVANHITWQSYHTLAANSQASPRGRSGPLSAPAAMRVADEPDGRSRDREDSALSNGRDGQSWEGNRHRFLRDEVQVDSSKSLTRPSGRHNSTARKGRTMPSAPSPGIEKPGNTYHHDRRSFSKSRTEATA